MKTTEHLSQPFRTETTPDPTFEAFVESHTELHDMRDTTTQLGARSLEFMPFGVDMTVSINPGEIASKDTTTNMGGKTDSCKDN
jgi:hypothetical protein